ncbi:MAG: HAMP domain-containing protein, partial [Candidatus Sumerlaeia bacterium]|nr:HAMP domain-containing protein [Candidatus Sumerlaeia bacterium]
MPFKSKPMKYLFRFSLRRKVFLIVLALGLIPSFLTLILSTAWAATALRQAFIQQATDEARTVAERLGDRIQGEISSLKAHAVDPSLEWVGDGPWRISRQVIQGDAPPGGLVEHFRNILDGRPQSDFFAFEYGHPPDQSYWGAVLLEDEPEEMWLLGEIQVKDLLDIVGSPIEGFGRDWMVLSSRSGVIGVSEGEELAMQFRELYEGLFQSPTGIITSDDFPGSAWVSVRVGAITSLSETTGDPVSLVVLRRADLSSGLNALAMAFWTMVLIGSIFVLAFGILGIWMSGKLVGPIKRLRAGFVRLREGDLDFRIEVNTGDEIQELGETMNEMAATLQATYRNLADKLLEIDEKARQITITHDLAQSVNRSLDFQTMMHEAVTEISQLVSVEWMALGLIDEEMNRMEIGYSWPNAVNLPGDGTSYPLLNSRTAQALKRGGVSVHRVDDSTCEEHRLFPASISHLCIVPLTTQEGPVGALLLAEKNEGGFREQHLRILEQLAASLATAIDHSRLYSRQAHFAQRLEEEVAARTRELEQAQEQLVRAEKMAAFGDLAANVAHEINNPLSIIKNYLALLENHIPATSGKDIDGNRELMIQGLITIHEEIDRIARIIDGLRSMRGDTPPRPMTLDVNEDIMTLQELFGQTFHKKQIKIINKFDPSIPICYLSRDYLRQVLINLLRNAADALDSGGTITITTRNNDPTPDTFSIMIQDNGTGIPKSCIDKIFDPFFTTKKDGSGTGLGLSISYRLATRMGGKISVKSEVGKGTLLTVILPHRQPPTVRNGPRP